MKLTHKQEVTKIVKLLKEGKVILYPTDTIWGIGCDAANEKAVKKLIKIKNREAGKSMLLLADHISLIEFYTEEIPDAARNIVEVSVEPITIIYPAAKNIPQSLIAEDGSVGFRVTSDPFCKLIVEQLNSPLVSTSANFSGEPFPESFSDISANLLQKVDYAANYRRDETVKSKPSAIIKISQSNEIKIIRS